MKNARLALAVMLALAAVPLSGGAQDKPKPDVKLPPTTLKVHVTVVEREGDKKVTNLPYTFFLRAGEGGPDSPWTKLRTGSRVPIYTGKEGGMQYIDVGTNIDARGVRAEDGRFDITLNLERSWVEGEVIIPVEKTAGTDSNPGHFKEPIIRQFKSELTLPLRDGQTSESTESTDPGSGRVLTITVSMDIIKNEPTKVVK